MERDNGGRAEREARHPIGVAAERTGLTPDVLRVWERRYGAVEPERSEGGQRLYTDADVERLRLLHRATLAGRSIGQVARLPTERVAAMVREDDAARATVPGRSEGVKPSAAEYVERAFDAALALDQEELELGLRRALAVLSAPVFLESVVAPLFRRIGEGWHAGHVSAAQEHAATAVIRRVLDDLLSVLAVPGPSPLLVVTTPSGDRHEIGALLVAAAALSEGWRVLYLGPDLPSEELVEVTRSRSARAVAVSAVYAPDDASLLDYVRTLRERLSMGTPVLVGGAAAGELTERLESVGALPVPDLDGLRTVLRAGLEEHGQ